MTQHNTALVKIEAIRTEMQKAIVGQEAMITRLLVALLTHSHILLEGVPGLAKTTAISSLAKILDMDFQRLQFTPDLLPSDLIGSQIYDPRDHSFSVKKGPLFAHFVLADEINRSPAKVQSALLEAMQEQQVTIGGETFPLPDPFLVMATQNPIEQEGTYPLPEAQVDRFLLKTVLDYPSREEEISILKQLEERETPELKTVATAADILQFQQMVREIYMDETVKKYVVDIVHFSRNPGEKLKKMIDFGASPRASLGLMKAGKAMAFLAGRDHVTPDDIKEIASDILRHRILPSYEAEAEGVTPDDLVKSILETVPVP